MPLDGVIGVRKKIWRLRSPWVTSPFRLPAAREVFGGAADAHDANMLLQGLAVGFAPTEAGLTLSLFNNTALAGRPAFRGLVPTPNYTHATGGASFSALI